MSFEHSFNMWEQLHFISRAEPVASIGCACVYSATNHSLYIIAGAGHELEAGVANAIWRYSISEKLWSHSATSELLSARYEHVAFIPRDKPTCIYILLGADTSGPVDDGSQVAVYDTKQDTWSQVSVVGQNPSPRTHHTTCCIDNRVFVFSGGSQGSCAAQDTSVYIFDARDDKWMCVDATPCPTARQGHVMVPYGDKPSIFLHGGMSEHTFCGDSWTFDTSQNTWSGGDQRNGGPCARAAHGAVWDERNNVIYMFGGICQNGALNDLWALRVGVGDWCEVVMSGVDVSPRLDLCMVRVPVALGELCASEKERGEATSGVGRCHVIILGGVSASGEGACDMFHATLSISQ